MAAAADSGGGGEKMIALVSSDNIARFEVREAAALLSQTVRRLIDEAGGADAASSGGGGGILLPNVDARTLARVLEYCNRHAPASSSSSAAAAAPSEDLERFDREFVRVDMDTLRSLIWAADYLKIEGLVKLTCRTIADMLQGKTTEQMREILGVSNDFTPEEEEEIRRENAWDFV